MQQSATRRPASEFGEAPDTWTDKQHPEWIQATAEPCGGGGQSFTEDMSQAQAVVPASLQVSAHTDSQDYDSPLFNSTAGEDLAAGDVDGAVPNQVLLESNRLATLKALGMVQGKVQAQAPPAKVCAEMQGGLRIRLPHLLGSSEEPGPHDWQQLGLSPEAEQVTCAVDVLLALIQQYFWLYV